jgi:hypothetical protein
MSSVRYFTTATSLLYFYHGRYFVYSIYFSVPCRKPSAFPPNQRRLAYVCVIETKCALNNSTPTTQRGGIAAHNWKFLISPCQNESTSQPHATVKILAMWRTYFETFYSAVFHAMPMASRNVYMLGNINNWCKTWSVMFKLLFGLHRGTEKERVKEELFQLTIPKYFT